MKHITMEEWIDFVNHVVSQEQQAAMQKHLSTAASDDGNNGSVEKIATRQRGKPAISLP